MHRKSEFFGINDAHKDIITVVFTDSNYAISFGRTQARDGG